MNTETISITVGIGAAKHVMTEPVVVGETRFRDILKNARLRYGARVVFNELPARTSQVVDLKYVGGDMGEVVHGRFNPGKEEDALDSGDTLTLSFGVDGQISFHRVDKSGFEHASELLNSKVHGVHVREGISLIRGRVTSTKAQWYRTKNILLNPSFARIAKVTRFTIESNPGTTNGNAKRKPKTIPIRIRIGTDNIPIEVDKSETVAFLKSVLHNMFDAPPPDQLRLVSAGRALEDGRTLSYYKIGKYSELHIDLLVRGGALRPTSARDDFLHLSKADDTKLALRVVFPNGNLREICASPWDTMESLKEKVLNLKVFNAEGHFANE